MGIEDKKPAIKQLGSVNYRIETTRDLTGKSLHFKKAKRSKK